MTTPTLGLLSPYVLLARQILSIPTTFFNLYPFLSHVVLYLPRVTDVLSVQSLLQAARCIFFCPPPPPPEYMPIPSPFLFLLYISPSRMTLAHPPDFFLRSPLHFLGSSPLLIEDPHIPTSTFFSLIALHFFYLSAFPHRPPFLILPKQKITLTL